MIETVFVLPGQGCYEPGAFAGYHAPELAEVFDAVDRVAAEFGRAPISALLRHPGSPSASALAASDGLTLQLAIYAAGLGWYRLATRTARPDVVVGHSMGEIAALVAAGAFDAADGARLVAHRAVALQERCPESGGMLALALNARRAQALVELVDDAGLAVAVCNAPAQTVVAGTPPSLAAVRRVAESLRLNSTLLSAPFPYHSPLLALAGPAFAAAIAGIAQHPLRLRVYSPVARRYLDDRVDARQLLVDQLTTPVDFLAAVRRLHDDGARTFTECGKVGLAGLIRHSVPDVTAVAAEAPVAAPPVAAPPVAAQPVATQPVAVQPFAAQPLAAQPVAVQQPGGYPAFEQPVYPPPVTFPAGQPAPVAPPVPSAQPTAQSLAGQATAASSFGQSFVQPAFVAAASTPFAAPEPIQPALLEPVVVQPSAIQPATFGSVQPGAVPVAFGQPGAAFGQPAETELSAPSQPPAVPQQPVRSPAGPSGSSEVLAQLRELYAQTLGYPVEAMTGDADLEADLGIDSLKRAEMLGKVRAHFGLIDSADDGRLLAQPTLGDLAELVAAAR